MMGPEIDVGALSQLSSENLRVLLRKIPGSKDLIIDRTLMKPLDKFAAMSLIKSCGVDKVFRLERDAPDSLSSTRVYFMLPELSAMRNVIEQINLQKINPGLSFHIIFVPKIPHYIELLLEEEGLYEKVVIHDYAWEIIPLDYDLLSMELPTLFGEIFCHEDTTLLASIPKSLHGIQALFGHIGNRFAIGRNAVNVLQQLDLYESANPSTKSLKGEISNMFIVDRSVDYATCLLSPLTYESLLDEVFSIVCGSVELDPTKMNIEIGSQMVVKLQLSSKDKMFEKIRNKHFATIFTSLSAYAKQLKHHQSRATTLSIAEMKEFVQKNLKEFQNQSKAVNVHIGAAEIIQKEKGPIFESLLPVEREVVFGTGYKDGLVLLEDWMAQLYPIEITLRLICLISLCNQGLVSGDLDRIKTQFLQTYGFEHLLTWDRLKQMGLISIRDSALSVPRDKPPPASGLVVPNFQQVSKKFGLVNKVLPQATGAASINPDGSGGPGYVFNGIYQPLFCKLIQEAIKPSNPKVTVADCLKELQIPHKIVSGGQSSSKVVLVFFIGGYTLVEVAAFRLLQANTGIQFIIAGTCNLSGKSLMKSVLS